MAKKGRKRRAQARQAAKRAPAVIEKNRPAVAPVEQPATGRSVNLFDEYRYVASDLKRIGILAVAMLALLVGLAVLAQFVF